jgi:energy-converting hydrogenase Eha subunit A
MTANIGRMDQIVRGLLGTACILAAGLGVVHGALQAVLVAAGCVGVFTASAGFCPVYHIIGRPTQRA